ncbi:unnamed protein product [Mycena citricolor]|uniref:ABM domain-containing protein n=1 Tax=Mycena citricolor TaxID=2018698 RepID=A0AAD2K8B6_9AGAR|nr:unnamed protein product [Mycena citricolor]
MSASPAEPKGEIVLTATITGKPGAGDEIEVRFTKLLAHVKQNEPGTLEYSIARNGSTDVFVSWERFKDMEALQAHSQNPLLAELKASGLMEKPPAILFYKSIQPAL